MSKTCKTCERIFEKEEDFLVKTSQWRICAAKNLWFNCSCNSTLMIPKGKFPWYRPDNGLSAPAKSLFNSLAGMESIPRIPSAIMELQTKINDPKIEISEISRILKSDPVLASEILGMANRLKNARAEDRVEIHSIDHAISYIGRKDVGQYLLTLVIKGFKIQTKVFNSDAFWADSFDRGRIAEFLAKVVGSRDMNPDEIYLAAALCNIGKIIGALLKPELIDRIEMDVSNPKKQCTWSDAELSYPEVSHVLLGEIAAAIWGLPEYILAASRFHHSDPKASAKLNSRLFIPELVSLANSCLHWVNGEPSRIDFQQFHKILSGFELTENDIEAMMPDIKKCLQRPR